MPSFDFNSSGNGSYNLRADLHELPGGSISRARFENDADGAGNARWALGALPLHEAHVKVPGMAWLRIEDL